MNPWILLLLVLLPNHLWAQDTTAYPYILKGYLGVEGGELFNYELHLRETQPGLYKGYALTYEAPKKDVKTAVSLFLDKANKKAILTEETIIHNNGFTSKVLICLLEADLKYDNKEQQFTGKIVTKMVSSALPCSSGSLVFSNKEQIEQLFNGISTENNIKDVKNTSTIKAPEKEAPKNIVYVDKRKPTTEVPKISTPSITTITEGKDNTINVDNKKIELHIKDDNTIDGDIISIRFNGNIILDNYKLTLESKVLHLDVGSNELNLISIEARNEGAEPPNTALITIVDGEKKHPIKAYNNVGKSAIIKIKSKL